MSLIAQADGEIGGVWFWSVFLVLVLAVMVFDLAVLHRRARTIGTREAFFLVCVWVGLAIAFDILILVRSDVDAAAEFATGYFVEYSLSVDNLFVFMLIFSYFAVPQAYQHRVLFWGIIGAAIMRMLFIFAAYGLVEEFTWLLYIFAAILIFSGIKFLVSKEIEVNPEKNYALRILRRFVRVTPEYHGARFFVRLPVDEPTAPSPSAAQRYRWFATPLLLVLVVVEATDVIFAVDSVPAILGVTKSSFIAYTSNIFAILGLRSMYFLLAGIMDKFRFLKVGLSIVLIFIGVKMALHHGVEIPRGVSLGLVLGVLAGSIVLSIYFPPPESPAESGGKNEHPAPERSDEGD